MLPLAPEKPTQDATPVKHGLSRNVRLRLARTWLARQPAGYTQGYRPDDAIQNGDSETYKVCCVVAHDHDLNEDDAFEALSEWNARCDPPWPEHALRAKIRSATKSATGARGAALRLILSPVDPLPSAREFVTREYVVDDTLALPEASAS